MLKYIRTGRPTDALSWEIDGLVEKYNDDRGWVGRVMFWEEDTKLRCEWAKEEGRAEGLEQGLEQGQDRFAALAVRLLEEARANDVARAAEDRSYREQLFETYGI